MGLILDSLEDNLGIVETGLLGTIAATSVAAAANSVASAKRSTGIPAPEPVGPSGSIQANPVQEPSVPSFAKLPFPSNPFAASNNVTKNASDAWHPFQAPLVKPLSAITATLFKPSDRSGPWE